MSWEQRNADFCNAQTDAQMAYIEAEREVDRLQTENAELRELVRDLWPFVKADWVPACPNRECCLFEECDADSEYECLIEEHMAGRMRELRVEVDG